MVAVANIIGFANLWVIFFFFSNLFSSVFKGITNNFNHSITRIMLRVFNLRPEFYFFHILSKTPFLFF